MKATSAERLRQLMNERNLTQKDILSLCKPYCDKYGVSISKSALSQYCSGKYEPDQRRLTILGMALNVNEAWLMGYDVPMERVMRKEAPTSESVRSKEEREFLMLFQSVPEGKREDVLQVLKATIAALNK